MVSQCGSTPPASHSDEVFAGMLDVFLNQFEECVNRINDTFAEGFQLYLDSEQIKEKHTLWKVKKVTPTATTSGEPHTPNKKTPGKGADADNVEMSQLSHWTPTFVEEVLQSVEKTDTTQNQIIEVVEQPPLVVTPISQKTADEYEFFIRRVRLYKN